LRATASGAKMQAGNTSGSVERHRGRSSTFSVKLSQIACQKPIGLANSAHNNAPIHRIYSAATGKRFLLPLRKQRRAWLGILEMDAL